jgi:hypothetical protein
VTRTRFEREVDLSKSGFDLKDTSLVFLSSLKEMLHHLLTEDHYIERYELDPSGCYLEPLESMYWYFCECEHYFILDFSGIPLLPWEVELSQGRRGILKLIRALEGRENYDPFRAIRGFRTRYERITGVLPSL